MLYWLTYHRPSYPSSSFLSSALSFLWRWLQHRMASCLSESRLRQIDRKDSQRLRRRCEAASPDLNVLEEGWSACEVLFRQELCSFTSINMHRRTTNCEYGQKHTQGPSSLQTPQVLPCEAIQLQTTKYSAMPMPCLRSTDSDKNSNEHSENSGLWNRSSQICFLGLWYVVSFSLCHGVYELNAIKKLHLLPLVYSPAVPFWHRWPWAVQFQVVLSECCIGSSAALHWLEHVGTILWHIKTYQNDSKQFKALHYRKVKPFSAAFGQASCTMWNLRNWWTVVKLWMQSQSGYTAYLAIQIAWFLWQGTLLLVSGVKNRVKPSET